MPFYVYEVVNEDGTTGEQFEVFQQMSEDSLTKHPEKDLKVQRVISVPFVPKQYHPQSTKKMLSDKNLDRMGFTKYVKRDDGTGYDKTAGSGPDQIKKQS